MTTAENYLMLPDGRRLCYTEYGDPNGRPGFGQTDFVEGITTVENWPNDIVALADFLRIDKFAVFAPSGGGPFALSCAWKIPDCEAVFIKGAGHFWIF